MMKKIFLLIAAAVFCLQAPASAQTQTLTLSTYYPAPFGSYDRLRLVPRTTGGLTCDDTLIGLLIYDTSVGPQGGLNLCLGATLGWSGSNSVWTQLNVDASNARVYPTETLRTVHVGIGTSTPDLTSKLNLHANTGNNFLYITNNGNTAGDTSQIWFARDYDGTSDWAGMGLVGNSGDLRFTTNNTSLSDANTQMVLQNNTGNVGIGTTAPASRLSVNGGISAGTYFANAAPANGMIVSGNIGIGIATPNANDRVHIFDADTGSDPQIYIQQDNRTTGDSAIEFSVNSNPPQTSTYILGIDHSDNDLFKISYSGGVAGSGALGTNDRFVINSTGNVGIGTTAPASALSVNGGISAGYPANAAPVNGMIVNGNVGIGTSNPQRSLHVAFSNNVSNGTNGRILVENTAGESAIAIKSASASTVQFLSVLDSTFDTRQKGAIQFLHLGTPPGGFLFYTSSAPGDWSAKLKLSIAGGIAVGTYASLNTPPDNGMIIPGLVGINKPVPDATSGVVLDINGNVRAGAFYYSSDESLKENILPLASSLEKVKALKGRSFVWKKTGEKDIGVVAQEVEGVYPEMVSTGADGTKSVKYANLVAPLIEAVKELSAQVDAQKSEIEMLKGRLDALEAAGKIEK